MFFYSFAVSLVFVDGRTIFDFFYCILSFSCTLFESVYHSVNDKEREKNMHKTLIIATFYACRRLTLGSLNEEGCIP